MRRQPIGLRKKLRELGEHCPPDVLVAAALPRVDDGAVCVDEDEVGLVVGSQRAGACPLRILDRGPGPAVALDECFPLVTSVGDVQAEVGDLRVLLLELCVGDRLALAGASPRRPDVDEHRSTPVVGERERLVVERRACDRRRSLAPRRGGRRLGLDGRPRRIGRLLTGAASAAARGDERTQRSHEHVCARTHAPHCTHVARGSGWISSIRFERCGWPAFPPIRTPCPGQPPSCSQRSCWRPSSARRAHASPPVRGPRRRSLRSLRPA